MVPVFRNVGERSTAKNYQPVSPLSVVCKVFEKLVNNKFCWSCRDKGDLFSDFQYGFTSSQSTADLLLIFSFLSNRWLEMFLDGKSSQEYPVNAGVSQGSIHVLHFSYYTLMTFLMMLSVILVYMLTILLSTLSVIRHLICGNNWNWLLNYNLIYRHWFHLIGLKT